MTTPDDLRTPPLRTAVYHILLALAGQPRHGLGVAEAIEADTDGVIELGPATLYRSLAEMVEAGLIERTAAPPSADSRRKYYAITAAGRELASAESLRLARLVEAARRRALLAERA